MTRSALLFLLLLPGFGICQKTLVPITILTTTEEFHYQHVISKRIDSSRFSFFNLTTFSTEYKSFRTNNTYLISNLFLYDLSKKWAIGAGGGLSSSGEFLSLGIRYLYSNSKFTFAYFPNMMYLGELLAVNRILIDYRPWEEKKLNPYFRFQIITSTDLSGKTNYNNLFRIGVEHGKTKIGFATPWFNPFTLTQFTTKQFGLFFGRSF